MFDHGKATTEMSTVPDAASSSGWDPELSKSLYALLARVDLVCNELASELDVLQRIHGDAVYTELIYLLSHLRFSHAEARGHWGELLRRRTVMQTALGEAVDLRVALVSYFVQICPQLENPKIVEMRIFEQARASTFHDELTGLRNFRSFGEHLTHELERAEQYKVPLSLLMIDVDDFCQYNECNGPDAGNRALASMARLLEESLRGVDMAARYGGEEFAVILPGTPKSGALLVAERIRREVQRHSFPGGKLSVSIGVSTYPADAGTVGELVRRADHAQVAAKMRGKNQVRLYGESSRSFQRVNVAFRGHYRPLVEEQLPLTVTRISEGGLLFLAKSAIEEDTLLHLDLELPRLECSVRISGSVVRSDLAADGRYSVAIRFLELSNEDRHLLAREIQESTEPVGTR